VTEIVTHGSTRGRWKPSSAGRHRSTLQLAAAWAGYGLLAGTVLTEARVLGLGVRADGRERDPGGADGATDGCDGTGPGSRPARA